MRRISILVALALFTVLPAFSWAGEEVQWPTPSQTYVDESQMERKDYGPGEAGVGLGEKVPTVLEPGLAAIDAQYQARLDAYLNQLTAATSIEDQELLQNEVMRLKKDWELATANRMLELARINGNQEQEAEIMQAIQHLISPPARDIDRRAEPAESEKVIERGER